MFDYIIRNALLIDGTGKPGCEADVAILDGKIAAIGEVSGDAGRTIDGRGLVLAPGFIDMHSHTDSGLFTNPDAESKVTQGVTLEVSGNCGFSSAPCLDEPGRAELDNWRRKYDIEDDWSTMGEFLDAFEKRAFAVNIATLVGHCNIRASVVGLADREASPEEIAQMRQLAADSIKEGAFGISTGLIYAPGCFADTQEIIEITKGVAPYGGFYATHMRDERDHLEEAVEETLRIGREAGVAVQISHHKACGKRNWGTVKNTLEMMRLAREEGMDVTADQYPYAATSTSLSIFLPNWAHDGGDKAMLERIRDMRPQLLEHLNLRQGEAIGGKGDWSNVLISSVRTDANRYCEGLNIEEIAGRRGTPPSDAVLDLLTEESGGVGMVQFAMCEEDIELVMADDYVMAGSDASARTISGDHPTGKPHPRAFGTMTRILGHYVRERKVNTLEKAIRKMTGDSARRLGITDRGTVRVGNWADVVVFNPNTVKDKATYRDPWQNSDGIEYVFVNGCLAVEQGELTGERAGRVIRKPLSS